MFKCTDCERVFREPCKCSELIVEFERSFYGCPYCGSEYYEDYYDEENEDDESEDDEEYE